MPMQSKLKTLKTARMRAASLKIGGSAVSLIALVTYTQRVTRPRPVRIVSQESLSGLQPVGTSPPPSFLPPPSAPRAAAPPHSLEFGTVANNGSARLRSIRPVHQRRGARAALCR